MFGEAWKPHRDGKEAMVQEQDEQRRFGRGLTGAAITVTAALGLVVLPGSAAAAEVSSPIPSTISIAAAPGEANQITVTGPTAGDTYTITDTGTAPSPGTGCVSGGPNSVTCDVAGFDTLIAELGDMDDSIDTSALDGVNSTLSGGDGGDDLTAGPGDDLLIGGPGDQADDDMDGGGGGEDRTDYSDTPESPGSGVSGWTMFATLDFDSGPNVLGDGSDTVTGIEEFVGSMHDDFISGDSAQNVLIGVDGNDSIQGLGGDDELAGGNGDNTATFITTTGDVVADLEIGPSIGTATGSGTGTDLLVDFDNIVGSGGNDTLTGNAGNNTLAGLGGTDTVTFNVATVSDLRDQPVNTTSSEGSDFVSAENLIGSSGNDTLDGDGASNRLQGGDGADTLRGHENTDDLEGGIGNDELAGGNGNDSGPNGGLDGGSGADQLSGDAGNDFVDGGAGDDGSVGSPTAGVDGGADDDTVRGGPGDDDLFGGTGINTLSFESATAGVDVSFVDGVSVGATEGADTFGDFQNLVGSPHDDFVVGDPEDNELTGGLGADTLEGLGGADLIRARDDVPADTVNCGSEVDRVIMDATEGSVDECETEDDPSKPTTPTIDSSNPGSGSNDNSPEIIGTAPFGSTVNLHTTSDCSGAPIASSTAAQFAGGGITINVADDSTTTLRAQVTTPLDVDSPSACSAAFTYVETTPDTTPDPDPDPGPPPPDPDHKPLNDIAFGKSKLNKKNGTAKLSVEVPGPGELVLSGKGVKGVEKEAGGEGTVTLPVKPKGKVAKKLDDKGKAKVSLDVTFTPTGGESNTESKKLTLKEN